MGFRFLGKYSHSTADIAMTNFVYSAIINVRHFGIRGLIKMPINIQWGATLKSESKSGISFIKPLKINMLSIKSGSHIKIEKGGKIVFTGNRACFSRYNNVLVFSSGVLEIGDKFWVNDYTDIKCRKRIKIGDNVIIAFRSLLIDTDFHPIYDASNISKIINPDMEITIGNMVWIGCNVTILKGVSISDNIIVGAGSLVNKSLVDCNSVYCGVPAKVVRNNVTWKLEDADY